MNVTAKKFILRSYVDYSYRPTIISLVITTNQRAVSEISERISKQCQSLWPLGLVAFKVAFGLNLNQGLNACM
jgi:hypothetical protein